MDDIKAKFEAAFMEFYKAGLSLGNELCDKDKLTPTEENFLTRLDEMADSILAIASLQPQSR